VEAQRLLDAGMPFHAHEVLEDAWKAADEPERGLWRGLAQLAVGLTHAARGNATGGAALLRRGAENISPYLDAPHGIDVAGLRTWANTLATSLDTTPGPADLVAITPRLVAS
jgi:predicted metal-dependent hydrolase